MFIKMKKEINLSAIKFETANILDTKFYWHVKGSYKTLWQLHKNNFLEDLFYLLFLL